MPIPGFLDDYAFTVKGLLDLYEASLNERWLVFAEKLHDIQDRHFWDEANGGYFSTTAEDPAIILRLKEGTLKSTRDNFSSMIKILTASYRICGGRDHVAL